MIQKELKIANPTGLDLGPAGVLCKTAMIYSSKIHFKIDTVEANAKSVLSVLGACVKCGDVLLFTFDGEDEEEASAGIEKIIEDRLGE